MVLNLDFDTILVRSHGPQAFQRRRHQATRVMELSGSSRPLTARCGAWSPGARRRRSSRDAIEKLNFVLLPRISSDPSEPVRLAPFESTEAGTIIAPTVGLSTEELSLGDDL